MSEPRRVYASEAQRRVLRELLYDGANNRTIALRLGLSLWTVKSHLAALYALTDTTDRASLAVAVLRKYVVIVTDRPRRESAA